METFWGLATTAWTAIYTVLTAGLLITAVIAAFYAARQWRDAREHAQEQRRAQIEAMRPYVTVTVEPSRTSMHLFDLIVRNIGQRPAQSVRIDVSPAPVRAREMGQPDIKMQNMKMLNEPIALLAPGQELRAFYDNSLERKDRDDLPTEHKVRVAYSDTSDHRYEGQFTLDLLALKGMSWTDVGTVHTLSQSLKKIEQVLSGSMLLKRGQLEVQAITETFAEARARRAAEDYKNLRAHVEMTRQVAPQASGRAGHERRLAEQESKMERDREDAAVAPIKNAVARGRHAIAWARRHLRDGSPPGQKAG